MHVEAARWLLPLEENHLTKGPTQAPRNDVIIQRFDCAALGCASTREVQKGVASLTLLSLEMLHKIGWTL